VASTENGHDGTRTGLAQQRAAPTAESHESSSREWVVAIAQGDHYVSRIARRVDASSVGETEVIWPTWPATVKEEISAGLPLTDLRQYWTQSGNRLRDSAKWMSTVLGAAIAALIGTSPLATLNGRHLHPAAAGIGLVGLLLIGITMVLVLRVMRPEAVSYETIETAQPPGSLSSLLTWLLRRRYITQRPLYRWRERVQSHKDLYLPCGVSTLTELRSAMALEEETLVELVAAGENAIDKHAADSLAKAQAARAARLLELRTAAAGIISVGEYYVLRARSTQATYGGTILGLLGAVAIVLAFTWPLS
jgi:hypothetical protein